MSARTARRPSLTTIVRRALLDECALPKGSRILVAVSGGPDSMALLSVLAHLGPKLGLSITAHGVDHGLRAEAARELDLAEELARRAGVPFDRSRRRVSRGGNVQARAREARWEALSAAARRADACIATAHHADDRAETVLIRLLRGAGAAGLGVLPPRATAPTDPRVSVVRPMLRARRADVLRYVKLKELPFAEDPSNADPRFVRTRLRRDVLPLLLELDPKVVEHLGFLADELAARAPRARTPDWVSALPRTTQEALARLLASGSRDERVWLPGGLVASLDPRAARPNQSLGK